MKRLEGLKENESASRFLKNIPNLFEVFSNILSFNKGKHLLCVKFDKNYIILKSAYCKQQSRWPLVLTPYEYLKSF